jgi:GH15 family glucan-1,4-alpha-glucosidase
MVDAAIERWPLPDHGIWEMRDAPRHFVHSKVMCWAAVHRGIALAGKHGLQAPLARWRAAHAEIRDAVMTHGVDRERGHFVARFDGTEVDAALLLLPDVAFVDHRDELMMRTAEAIRLELGAGRLVLRYREPDGLRGDEGVFLPCSFWLAECLARQGRGDEARAIFERASACANDLGLFPEEYDTVRDEMLGNYPQGLTHLAHISAALALRGVTPPQRDAGKAS